MRPPAAPLRQVDQLGDDEAGGGDDMEAVPVEDEHGHVSVVRRKRLVFGQIKCAPTSRALPVAMPLARGGRPCSNLIKAEAEVCGLP